MARLSVNVNKVATLRNTRTIGIPSVVHAAHLCVEAGAHGITVHPRPDRRHVTPQDVYEIAELLKAHRGVEFNIEGNPFHDYLHFAREVRPTQCTLVPDEPDAFTSNQGWDLIKDGDRLRPVIAELRGYGCRVSLFMDAGSEGIELAAELGADRIELYTEPYAAAFAAGEPGSIVEAFTETALRAHAAGLGVNAGHDLNLENLSFFLARVPNVEEVSIGHALIADALQFGLPETVKKYLALVG